MSCGEVVRSILEGFEDVDILEYLVGVIDDMSLEERNSFSSFEASVSPFLLSSGYSVDDCDASAKSLSIFEAIKGNNSISSAAVESIPEILNAPVVMVHNSDSSKTSLFNCANEDISSGSDFQSKKEEVTSRDARKDKKANEQHRRAVENELRLREEVLKSQQEARLSVLKASRGFSRQAYSGLNLEGFSLPSPSGSGDLLSDVSLILTFGHRYGLIGKNGVGKSTLMAALASYKYPQLEHLRIMLVDQHVEGDHRSAIQWVLQSDIERTFLLEREALLNALIYENSEAEVPDDLKGQDLHLMLTECYERMDILGLNTSEQRARRILSGLGFDDKDMEIPTEKLSGGWAMRAALASAVFVKPDLLLLDEPTNHLDVHALVWLETWITSHFEGMAIIVSHDRCFLAETCTDILEMRSFLAGQQKNTLEHFPGDYFAFEKIVEERRVVQDRLRATYERERDKLKEFIGREGKKYDNPAHQSQRKMKMKQLSNLIEVEAVEEESETLLRFPFPHGNFSDTEKLITLSDVSFSYGEDVLPLFTHVEFNITSKSRIAFVGKNGCGKTSLLNLMMGTLQPTQGRIARNPSSRIALLQQHHYKGEQLSPDLHALDHMRLLPQEESTAVGMHDFGTRQEESAQRSYLAGFGLHGWKATVPVKYMSGGQRMRVAMAVALYRRPDCIILDEPTNHLDAETVAALADAVMAFEGAVLVVSHDEEFVNKILRSNSKKEEEIGDLMVFQDHSISRFSGSFTDYKKQILKKVQMNDKLLF